MYQYKRLFVVVCLIAGSGAVLSQPQARSHERDTLVRTQAADRDGQTRRAGLRDTLQSRRDHLEVAQSSAGLDRQLNAKERGELRQQLRQQKRDWK